MRYFLIFLALFLAPSVADDNPYEGKIYLADARSRCTTANCTCRVNPGAPPTAEVKTVMVDRSVSLYFTEASYTLDAKQVEILRRWLRPFDGQRRSVTLSSYTDGVGTAQDNITLATNRNATVKGLLMPDIPSSGIRSIIVGENVSGYDPRSRRVDVVVHTPRTLTTKIDKVRADVYLIDASGSMWGRQYRHWTDVVNASFKPGSKIYLSIMKGCRNGQVIDNVTPQGGTEIWYSYWTVLDSMRPGQTLAIVSDFQSNYPLTSSEHVLISKKVRDKGVKVIAIRP